MLKSLYTCILLLYMHIVTIHACVTMFKITYMVKTKALKAQGSVVRKAFSLNGG